MTEKILILSRDFNHFGGVVNYTKILYQNVDRNKFEVSHYKIGRPVESVNLLSLIFIIINQYIVFKRIINEFKPSLVHINPSIGFTSLPRDIIYLLISKINGIKVLLFIRGWDKQASIFFFSNMFLKSIIIKALDLSSKILVLSTSFKTNLVDMGISRDKISITTTIVDAKKYYKEPRLIENQANILFCSRVEKDKGIYHLIYAFYLIRSIAPQSKLFIVGSGSELENLSKKIKALDLEDSVIMAGYRSGKEKIDYYKKSHIFVLPSFQEGLPNVFCEALASGLPFISTPVGGLADALVDGKQGFVINSMPPRPREIALQVIRLIQDPAKALQMASYNLNEAKNIYDKNPVVKNMEYIYSQECQ